MLRYLREGRGREMRHQLWQRVQAIMMERAISPERLQELMGSRGINYEPAYMDTFANPDDIRTIADIIQVPASELLEATSYIGDLIAAVFQEEWANHASKVNISEEEAFRRVHSSEYRWNSPKSPIRDQIKLVLAALEPPAKQQLGCQYPDCDCGLRCVVTGRFMGPEG